jgi:hypothetical protein
MALTSTARWLIYAEVMICFGTLALTWLFGLVLLPVWLGMMSAGIRDPVHNPGALTVPLLPTLAVIAGAVGFIGIFRVCRLLSRNATRASNVLTLVAVAIGFIGLLVWAVVISPAVSDSWEEILDWATWAYLILPVSCAAHLVFLVRKPLAVWRRNDSI